MFIFCIQMRVDLRFPMHLVHLTCMLLEYKYQGMLAITNKYQQDSGNLTSNIKKYEKWWEVWIISPHKQQQSMYSRYSGRNYKHAGQKHVGERLPFWPPGLFMEMQNLISSSRHLVTDVLVCVCVCVCTCISNALLNKSITTEWRDLSVHCLHSLNTTEVFAFHLSCVTPHNLTLTERKSCHWGGTLSKSTTMWICTHLALNITDFKVLICTL